MRKISWYVSIIWVCIASLKCVISGSSCDTSNVFGKQWISCTEVNCPSDSVRSVFEDGVLRRKNVLLFLQR